MNGSSRALAAQEVLDLDPWGAAISRPPIAPSRACAPSGARNGGVVIDEAVGVLPG
jgi:hypothetical protein